MCDNTEIERDHGLNRCSYKGLVRMNRWVDNLIYIGRTMQGRPAP